MQFWLPQGLTPGMFCLPGIFRSVCLTSLPKVHIADMRMLAGMDGEVSVNAVVNNL